MGLWTGSMTAGEVVDPNHSEVIDMINAALEMR